MVNTTKPKLSTTKLQRNVATPMKRRVLSTLLTRNKTTVTKLLIIQALNGNVPMTHQEVIAEIQKVFGEKWNYAKAASARYQARKQGAIDPYNSACDLNDGGVKRSLSSLRSAILK